MGSGLLPTKSWIRRLTGSGALLPDHVHATRSTTVHVLRQPTYRCFAGECGLSSGRRDDDANGTGTRVRGDRGTELRSDEVTKLRHPAAYFVDEQVGPVLGGSVHRDVNGHVCRGL